MCDEYSDIADLLHDLADSREQRNECVNWLVLCETLDLNKSNQIKRIQIF